MWGQNTMAYGADSASYDEVMEAVRIYYAWNRSDQTSRSTCETPLYSTGGSQLSSPCMFLLLATDDLHGMCLRYDWPPPIYDYKKHVDATGAEIWVGQVYLQLVGPPIVGQWMWVGPVTSSPGLSMQMACVDAAEKALHLIWWLNAEMQRTQTLLAQGYYFVMPPLPTCVMGNEYVNTFLRLPPPFIRRPN